MELYYYNIINQKKKFMPENVLSGGFFTNENKST